ncbi:MAG: TonB-dependent receptor [Cyclobacteriaceae bacterium]|nr:TonB-dependent receptor [Cyclobacteriaceae bacterium]
MKKRIFLIWMVFVAGTLAAQVQVKGRITSADDGMGLPGVNVVVRGTAKGTASDANGDFAIEIGPGENTLVFTFIGYKTQTVNVDGRETVNISMEPEAQALEEVVVVGYGTVRKSDLTGSVSSIRGNQLTTVPAINPMQSLQGRVPGLQVALSSGAPGAGTYVRIRGIGTFNDASPIYVVDGVIMQNIDFLNSADIASMEVLKDASATAIYGARGANGVIIVTTKKGDRGSTYPTINVISEYSVQELPKKIDLLNGREYAIVRNKINPGTYNNVDAVPNTDWQDLIFRTAPIQNYQISFAGGSDKFQYYTSLGYFKQDGIISKSDFQRVTLKFNNTLHVSENVRVGSNISFTPYDQQNTNGNAVFVVYRAWPTIEPFQPDGSFSPVPGVGNVLADINYTNSFNKGIRSVNNFYTEIDFLKGFTFRSSFGADLEYTKSTSYTPVFFVNPQQQNATDDLGKGYFDRLDWLWENTLNFTREFGVHRIDALAGYTLQESSSETVFLGAENLIRPGEDFWYVNIFPNLVSPNFARNDVNAGYNFSMISYLFRANYSFKNRYLFTATFRRDGSSKFTEQNRFANFPSFAVGWNAINENFLANNNLFSNLKFRASWGIIGNEKINYLRQYSLVLNGINALFGNDVQFPGATYGVSGNSNLKWESTKQINVGLEVGFFNDKLTAEIDYFNRKTSDILIDLPVPGYYGNGDGALITFNAGEVLNRGIETVIGWKSEYKDLRYGISANLTTLHNETLKVSGTGGSDEQLIGLFNGRQVTRTVPGLPIGSFYGYQVIGVFQNQAELDSYPHLSSTEVGDLKFADIDNNGILNSADRTNLGSPIPTLLYGLNITGEYKRFDVMIDFQGQSGNKIFNGKEIVRPDPYNFERRYFYFWDGEGTSNTEPRPSNGGINFEPSSRYIYDGSFFRLRNLSIGYLVPENLVSKVGMKSVRAYVRVTNLFTISSFTGYTPEIVSGNPVLNGIDIATYPIPRIYSLGLNLTF